MRTQSNSRSWIDVTNLVLGMILFCLPWTIGMAEGAIGWNAWIIGGVVAFNAACAVVGLAAWEEWTNLILGLWAVMAPWLFGFERNVDATSTFVLLGFGMAGLAIAQLWLVNRQEQPGLTI
jgi:SPW repeat